MTVGGDDGVREPDEVAASTAALGRALGRSAERAAVRPTPQALRAVAETIGRRARRRRTGRAAAVGAGAAGLLLVGIMAGRSGSSAGDAVVAGASNGTGAGGGSVVAPEPEVVAGPASGDPHDLGLPRLVLGPGSGLEPEPEPDPGPAGLVAETVALERPSTVAAQLFHPPDSLFPLVVAPWIPSAADRPLPRPGRDGWTAAQVGPVGGAIRGTAPGPLTLAWAMPDATKAYLVSTGVEAADLAAFAAGLGHPSGTGTLYTVGRAPDGMGEEQVVVAAPDVGGRYATTYRDAEGAAAASLEVVDEGTGGIVDDLVAALATTGAPTVQPDRRPLARTVAGRPALAVPQAAGWLVVWEPKAGVTARLRVGSTATTELDRLVDAVTELDRRAWDAWSGSDGARR